MFLGFRGGLGLRALGFRGSLLVQYPRETQELPFGSFWVIVLKSLNDTCCYY